MYFQSWESFGRTFVAGTAAYVALVVFLRISGKRTLAKMNAFDLVVTVSLGSTLSTVLVSRQVPLADGIAALGLLVLLQFAVAWASVRSPGFETLVKNEPSLLAYRGELRRQAMNDQRVSEEEVLAALRSAGLAGPRDAGAVVLETDGSFSVIASDALPADGSVAGLEAARPREAVARAPDR